jgi:hypothetical protein
MKKTCIVKDAIASKLSNDDRDVHLSHIQPWSKRGHIFESRSKVVLISKTSDFARNQTYLLTKLYVSPIASCSM